MLTNLLLKIGAKIKKKVIMECVICKNGNTHKGKTIFTLERNGTIVIIKGVPAMICENCGEYTLTPK